MDDSARKAFEHVLNDTERVLGCVEQALRCGVSVLGARAMRDCDKLDAAFGVMILDNRFEVGHLKLEMARAQVGLRGYKAMLGSWVKAMGQGVPVKFLEDIENDMRDWLEWYHYYLRDVRHSLVSALGDGSEEAGDA